MYLRRILREEIHVSWLVAASCAGVMAGVLIAFRFEFVAQVAWLVAVGCIGFIVFRYRKAGMLIPAFLVGGFVGLYFGSITHSEIRQYKQYYGSNVTINGSVRNDPIVSENGDLQFQLKEPNIDHQPMIGNVWISSSTKKQIKRGDVVEVSGGVTEGFGTFQAAMFRAQVEEVTRPSPGDVARQVRDRFNEGVYQVLQQPEAHLGISYITGQRNLLSPDQAERLRMLGLVHVVVASGFHLTIVVRFARRISQPISKYFALSLSLMFIVSFLLLTGFSTSMTRGSLVASLSLLAWYYGRTIHPVVLLLFVAAVTVLVDPIVITGDLGWYLSFAAFGGVIILAPLIDNYFWGNQTEPGMMRQIFVATTSAQITTFPIIVYSMGQYSPLALLANLLVLPLVPFAMLATFVSGLVGVVFGSGFSFIGWPAYILLRYMTLVTERLSQTPWSVSEVSFSMRAVLLSYVFIFLLVILLWRATKHRFRNDTVI